MRVSHVFVVAAAAVLFALPVVQAGTVTYATRTDFNTAFPGLPVEDFEESAAVDTGFVTFSGPLDSTTNNAAFAAGSILPGLAILDSPGPGATGLLAGGADLFVGNTKNVGTNTFDDSLDLLFAPGIYAVGFDLSHSPAPGATSSGVITVEIHGAGGLLATYSPNVSGISFFGVSSDTDAIVRISLLSTVGGAEFVDNVTFDAGQEVPEPASLLLTLLGGAALLGFRRAGR